MDKRFRNRFLAVCAVLALCVAGFVAFKLCADRSVYVLKREVYALPTDVSVAELEKRGYLNLTGVQSGIPKRLNSLLSGKNVVTFIDTEEGPMIQIFSGDRKTRLVTMCTNYSVRNQSEEGPGRVFHLRFDLVEAKDDVVEVWLRAADVASPQNLDRRDYLLLTYQ